MIVSQCEIYILNNSLAKRDCQAKIHFCCYNLIMKAFAERLRELRLSRDLSQQELGEKLTVNRKSISHWERNTYEPDYETLVKIAQYFEVSTDYLLGLSD